MQPILLRALQPFLKGLYIFHERFYVIGIISLMKNPFTFFTTTLYNVLIINNCNLNISDGRI